MILLLDAGNTRLKWALADGLVLSTTRHVPLGTTGAAAAVEALAQAMRTPVARIVVANVAGDAFAAALRQAAPRLSAAPVEFVVPTREGFGLRCAYADPRRLGADRWAAMIAARASTSGPAVVVSVGTALTLDGVAPDGEHVGGLILPGPASMARSLHRDTQDIGDVAPEPVPGLGLRAVGRSTAECVAFGSHWALVGAVQRAVAELASAWHVQPRALITGGAAALLSPHLPFAVEWRPQLVLEGLARIAQAADSV